MMVSNASKLRRQVMYISPAIRALIRIFMQHPDNKISIIEEICLYD